MHQTRAQPYYVQPLAIALTTYLLGAHLWTWVFQLSTFLGGRADFRHLYVAGCMVRLGEGPYLYDYASQLHWQNALSPGGIPIPFNHPAYEALFFIPFSFLRYRPAYVAFLALNIALLVGSLYMLRPWMANLRNVFRLMPVMMFVSFLPVAAALMNGQDSILLLTLFVSAAVLIHSGRDMAAGLLVGLGLFKFQIVIPIAILFLIWRHWRFCFGFSISALSAGLTSLWIVGGAQARAYGASLLSMSVSSSRESLVIYSIKPEAMGNLRGLIFGLMSGHLSNFSIQAVTIVLSVLVMIAIGVAGAKLNAFDALLIAITTSAVVSYHFLIHDMSVLLIPIVVFMDRFIFAEATGDKSGRLITRVAALLFIAPLTESIAPDHFYIVALPLCFFLSVLVTQTLPSNTKGNPPSFVYPAV